MSAIGRRLAMPRFKARKGDEMDTAAEVLQLAQQAADRAIADAQREAEKILAQASLEAEQIIADARARAEDL
jgi:cell division septum initiation protein DivIVA